jgi:hypothetical protein
MIIYNLPFRISERVQTSMIGMCNSGLWGYAGVFDEFDRSYSIKVTKAASGVSS